MALSLAIIGLLGITAHYLFTKLRLPGFLGILFVGIAIGPNALNWIDESILIASEDLRKMALIIILLRAGMGLHRQTLKMVGAPAIRLGFIPVLFEGFMVLFVAWYFWDLGFVEAGMLGFILAAVSPAVIVPKMLSFIDRGKGSEKGIPTMILAGASLDDVVAITIFSAFAGFYGGQQVNITTQVLSIPVAVITGIALGIVIAFLLLWIFRKFETRNTKKVLIMLGAAILLTTLESVQSLIPLASLLGVMVIGFIILEKEQKTAIDLSSKLNKSWIFAEIILFTLVGAEVDVFLALEAGVAGLLIIAAGLLARSVGVMVSLIKTGFSFKERFFCILAYSPKATVQAAIGAVPMAMGVPGGDVILTIAVLSIVVTAPLGAIAMNFAGERILK
ncbi:cation:proton antiporter [Alkalitalea saponilacus]|uniref:Sodium/proton antiporter, CPA1 family n=1 Tax=Alkalitalea saponilacus TaxID=889453 RepID=A0A1T5HT70_9BACT|nr:cation:proton antiporter [Alkalitalea saponilacus]ASB47669.1 potassium transporter [Alkalitalea saponilacus]SKC23812.1 sodium/proton antiporter, CPA1 family [Alkalitalea saponilacus]